MKETRSLPAELFAGRTLIFQLAKNDFKKKYAGSYLGIVWAFVQPVVTVMVYWFVFGMIRSSSPRPVPFVLWLIAGLIPWFFFQDGLINGTNALLEYNYLVKKVVFRIDILPMVKVVSAVFVHLFFILVALILYTAMGCYPTVYTIQVIYYTFCIFVLVLGITYMTSSVVVFFRDLTQVINIALQVGVWMTPIMWSMEDLGITGILASILKLNPMFYIVQGYRDAFIYKIWFWQRPGMTLYFWAFTLVFWLIGTRLFRKLKIHFVDVL